MRDISFQILVLKTGIQFIEELGLKMKGEGGTGMSTSEAFENGEE